MSLMLKCIMINFNDESKYRSGGYYSDYAKTLITEASRFSPHHHHQSELSSALVILGCVCVCVCFQVVMNL